MKLNRCNYLREDDRRLFDEQNLNRILSIR